MVYIIGIGRSGSTLLTYLLNNHPEIKAVPEVPLVLFFANDFQNIQKKSIELEKYTKEYLDTMQLMRPKALVSISNVVFEDLEYETYTGFCDKVVEQFQMIDSKGVKKVYVDKNPQYSLFIPELRRIDSKAKFILLVRDYRDNVLSRNKKQNNKPTNLAYNAFRNRFFLKELAKNKNHQDCFVLTYEDLVTFSREKITEVCNFLNVPFDEDVFKQIEYNSNDLDVEFNPLNDFVHAHFSQLNKPITTNAVGKWKKELKESEVQLIESICNDYGVQFGYHKSTRTKNYYWLILLHLPQFLLAKWHILKDRLIYYVPSSIKLKRLKKIHQKFLS
ncbi:MAG: sulfotransferase family protein [Crocinitomicaceae bacterium]